MELAHKLPKGERRNTYGAKSVKRLLEKSSPGSAATNAANAKQIPTKNFRCMMGRVEPFGCWIVVSSIVSRPAS